MKRVSAHPTVSRTLELFDAVVREKDIRLAEGTLILDRLAGIASEPFPEHLLHGKRVEAMFGHVVAELDACQLIKEEDAGEMLIHEETATVAVPDYRLITRDGRTLLIEVKNVHGADATARLVMRPSYIEGLRAYSKLNRCDVLVAVYWSRWNVWTLVSLDDLLIEGTRHRLTFPQAIRTNRMAWLGDFSVGVRPPLRLRLLCDPVQLEFGQTDVKFTTRGFEFYCVDRLLTTPEEQRLALFLMLFGGWDQEPARAVMNDQLVMSALEFVAEPEQPTPNQGFEIVDAASSMLSRAYQQSTVSMTGEIERLRPSHLPASIVNVFPLNYTSERLPLWRFTLVPPDSETPSSVSKAPEGSQG